MGRYEVISERPCHCSSYSYGYSVIVVASVDITDNDRSSVNNNTGRYTSGREGAECSWVRSIDDIGQWEMSAL